MERPNMRPLTPLPMAATAFGYGHCAGIRDKGGCVGKAGQHACCPCHMRQRRAPVLIISPMQADVRSKVRNKGFGSRKNPHLHGCVRDDAWVCKDRTATSPAAPP